VRVPHLRLNPSDRGLGCFYTELDIFNGDNFGFEIVYFLLSGGFIELGF